MKKSFIQWILPLFACAILVTSFAAFGQGSNCGDDGNESN